MADALALLRGEQTSVFEDRECPRHHDERDHEDHGPEHEHLQKTDHADGPLAFMAAVRASTNAPLPCIRSDRRLGIGPRGTAVGRTQMLAVAIRDPFVR